MKILTIQAIPPSPNVVKRKYRSPYAYKRLRMDWEWMLIMSLAAHHREELRAAAKTGGMLWCQITIHHSKLFDEDNLQGAQKVVLDALVNIHFLKGDSPDKLRLLPAEQVKCARKECKTVIKVGVVD